MLRACLLRNFCCCIPLRHGVIAIGSLEWMYTLFLICKYNDFEALHCAIKKVTCNQIYYNIVSFVVGTAVISGVTKRNKQYFVPWLIIKFIEFAALTTIMIYFLQKRFTPTVEVLWPLSFVILSAVLLWYCWYCVLSMYFKDDHFEELKDMDQNSSQFREMV